jgi:hypothetical protein
MWQNIMPCHFRLYHTWQGTFQEYVVHVIKIFLKGFYHVRMLTHSQDNIVVSKDSWWTTHKQIGMLSKLFMFWGCHCKDGGQRTYMFVPLDSMT